MTRFVPALLQAELDSRKSYATRGFVVTPRNGNAVRFAMAQSPKTVPGVGAYLPAKGIKVSSIPLELNGPSSTVDFTFAASSSLIPVSELRAGVYDGASVLVSVFSQKNPSAGKVDIWRGLFGDMDLSDRRLVKVQAVGLLSKARAVAVKRRHGMCRHDFGDAGCGIDLAPLTASATVVSVNGRFVTVSGLAAADGYYREGMVIGTSGRFSGWGIEIREWTNATQVIELYADGLPFEAGDTVNVIPGCKYTRDWCRDNWNNVINMDAEPDAPGADIFNFVAQEWGA